MKGQLIFRIFVDISLYPYEFFVLRGFIIHLVSFVIDRQFTEINQSNSSSVKVNGYRTSSMEIKQGVPQGWVLGLLLFLL
jgi:hypothetical protein